MLSSRIAFSSAGFVLSINTASLTSAETTEDLRLRTLVEIGELLPFLLKALYPKPGSCRLTPSGFLEARLLP